MTPTDWKEFRRDLHRHPELSRKEKRTHQKIEDKLRSFRPDELITVAKTGLIAIFKGKEKGNRIMLRTDIDALPIQEVNTFDHRSQTDGVSHKCGHDGHATIMLSVAEWLSENRPEKGEVWLLFQPAEEIGWGAAAVLAEEVFRKIEIDHVFALHNIPGAPMHQVIVKDDAFTPSVTSPLLFFKGRTSHAAEPEKGNNPAEAIAQTLEQSLSLALNDPTSENMVVVTPVYMQMGEKAYGTSAGEGELHLTVRTWSNELLQDACAKIEKVAKEKAEDHKLGLEIRYTESFAGNENDPVSVEKVRTTARILGLDLYEKPEPFKWGEDFGLFTQRFRGCMFGLGSGRDTPALHNPDYDFPDELIPTGRDLFKTLIQQCL